MISQIIQRKSCSILIRIGEQRSFPKNIAQGVVHVEGVKECIHKCILVDVLAAVGEESVVGQRAEHGTRSPDCVAFS